jgi:hypothetical protein
MKPLYLPAGSVRAIIALALIGTACACVACNKTIPEGFFGMAGIVVGWYFAKREAKEA